MKVPFLDLKSQNSFLKEKLFKATKKVLDSCDFVLGQEVRLFEQEFAAYCGCQYAVGLNSGTDALFLSLLSLGIGPQDEVICPVYTYIATALAISYTGAKPVFVDIDERTFNINPKEIERKINKKTKAIVVVHLYGQSAQMSSILDLARTYKLKVIEDVAQAHGALWLNEKNKWQKVGGIGDVGCFSFYPTKNLSGSGDAGAITTNNQNIYEKILILRDQGRKGKNRYTHYIKGYNSRLDSLQAALLRVKLRYLDRFNKMRYICAELYSKLLCACAEITLPFESSFTRHVFHIYAIRIKNRDKVHLQLKDRGIFTSINYHLPLHLQPAYSELKYKKGDFPQAEKISKEILCLPIYPHLKQEKIKFVVKSLKELNFNTKI